MLRHLAAGLRVLEPGPAVAHYKPGHISFLINHQNNITLGSTWKPFYSVPNRHVLSKGSQAGAFPPPPLSSPAWEGGKVGFAGNIFTSFPPPHDSQGPIRSPPLVPRHSKRRRTVQRPTPKPEQGRLPATPAPRRRTRTGRGVVQQAPAVLVKWILTTRQRLGAGERRDGATRREHPDGEAWHGWVARLGSN